MASLGCLEGMVICKRPRHSCDRLVKNFRGGGTKSRFFLHSLYPSSQQSTMFSDTCQCLSSRLKWKCKYIQMCERMMAATIAQQRRIHDKTYLIIVLFSLGSCLLDGSCTEYLRMVRVWGWIGKQTRDKCMKIAPLLTYRRQSMTQMVFSEKWQIQRVLRMESYRNHNSNDLPIAPDHHWVPIALLEAVTTPQRLHWHHGDLWFLWGWSQARQPQGAKMHVKPVPIPL